jgi:hypothetical protein
MKSIESYDWERIAAALNSQGNAVLERLLSVDECSHLAGLYPEEHRFRNRIVIARHGFGQGEYRYFSYPLPDLVASLRTVLYTHLAPIANQWAEAMSVAARYPP